MADRYWIGGTGNYSSTSHWSSTSGGGGGATVPSSSDNVFIDANSGFSSGGTITEDGANTRCLNFTSTSGHNYTIKYETSYLTVYGNVTLESGVTFDFETDSYLIFGGVGVQTLTSNNANLYELLVNEDSVLYLLDNLTVLVTVDIRGGLYSGNYTIDCNILSLDATAEGDLGESFIYCNSLINSSNINLASIRLRVPSSLPMVTASGTIQTIYGVNIPILRIQGEINTYKRAITGTCNLPTLSIAGKIIQSTYATITYIVPSIKCSLEGGGELTFTIPSIKLSSNISTNSLTTLSKPIPAITLSSVAYNNEFGTVSFSIPAIRLSASGDTENTGTLEKPIPAIKLTSSIVNGFIGTLSSSFAALKLISSAHWTSGATLNKSIPSITLRSYAVCGNILAILMNTKNFALTEYNNYNYNSFGILNGKTLGATSTGIYELTGTDDNGDNIEWNFKTGKIDFSDKNVNKINHVWLSYKPSGDLTLVVDDGEHEYEYDVESYKQIDNAVRVKTGKGIRNRFIQLELKNNENESITLDRMRIFAEPIGKIR